MHQRCKIPKLVIDQFGFSLDYPNSASEMQDAKLVIDQFGLSLDYPNSASEMQDAKGGDRSVWF